MDNSARKVVWRSRFTGHDTATGAVLISVVSLSSLSRSGGHSTRSMAWLTMVEPISQACTGQGLHQIVVEGASYRKRPSPLRALLGDKGGN